jgi:L-ascorbate metabolism protein UlaG (beta-lactamase superfamily)
MRWNGPLPTPAERSARRRLAEVPAHDQEGQRASTIRVTHIGGPTALIEFGGWRILTDPTFDNPGGAYHFGWGTGSRKLTGPAIAAGELGPIDAVLLSHDHHADNLDRLGRAVLPLAGTVITTASAAQRLGANAIGLRPWKSTVLDGPMRSPVEITATPCRHGPPLSGPLVGDVVGFALKWHGQENGVLWISGDTVLYGGVREIARRLPIGVAILHLGGARFPVTGPLRYSMTVENAIELCRLVQPTTVIPVHYEGWSHFRQGGAAIEAELAKASPDIRRLFRVLRIGASVDIAA